MVDSVGFVNAVSGAPAYNGRMLRQLNAVGFAGATAARPLGARSGVRPGTSPTTVSATSTTWTCQPFAGLLDGQVAGEAGPYPFSFDAVATGAVTAANASNPRIDIIYVDVDDPSEDASSVPAATRKYLAGTAAATPVAPSAPAGCMTVAQINVPKSGGGSPTVTWVAPYCAAAGGVVDFNTKAELDLWTDAPPNQRARVLATLVEYVRSGGVWKSGDVSARAVRAAITVSVASADYTNVSANANWSTAAPVGEAEGFSAYANGWTVPVSGVYELSWALATTSTSLVGGITVNKSSLVNYTDFKAIDSAPLSGGLCGAGASEPVYLVAGDVLRLYAIAGSGTATLAANLGHFSARLIKAA